MGINKFQQALHKARTFLVRPRRPLPDVAGFSFSDASGLYHFGILAGDIGQGAADRFAAFYWVGQGLGRLSAYHFRQVGFRAVRQYFRDRPGNVFVCLRLWAAGDRKSVV
jgi:hypothetical protein